MLAVFVAVDMIAFATAPPFIFDELHDYNTSQAVSSLAEACASSLEAASDVVKSIFQKCPSSPTSSHRSAASDATFFSNMCHLLVLLMRGADETSFPSAEHAGRSVAAATACARNTQMSLFVAPDSPLVATTATTPAMLELANRVVTMWNQQLEDASALLLASQQQQRDDDGNTGRRQHHTPGPAAVGQTRILVVGRSPATLFDACRRIVSSAVSSSPQIYESARSKSAAAARIIFSLRACRVFMHMMILAFREEDSALLVGTAAAACVEDEQKETEKNDKQLPLCSEAFILCLRRLQSVIADSNLFNVGVETIEQILVRHGRHRSDSNTTMMFIASATCMRRVCDAVLRGLALSSAHRQLGLVSVLVDRWKSLHQQQTMKSAATTSVDDCGQVSSSSSSSSCLLQVATDCLRLGLFGSDRVVRCLFDAASPTTKKHANEAANALTLLLVASTATAEGTSSNALIGHDDHNDGEKEQDELSLLARCALSLLCGCCSQVDLPWSLRMSAKPPSDLCVVNVDHLAKILSSLLPASIIMATSTAATTLLRLTTLVAVAHPHVVIPFLFSSSNKQQCNPPSISAVRFLSKTLETLRCELITCDLMTTATTATTTTTPTPTTPTTRNQRIGQIVAGVAERVCVELVRQATSTTSATTPRSASPLHQQQETEDQRVVLFSWLALLHKLLPPSSSSCTVVGNLLIDAAVIMMPPSADEVSDSIISEVLLSSLMTVTSRGVAATTGGGEDTGHVIMSLARACDGDAQSGGALSSAVSSQHPSYHHHHKNISAVTGSIMTPGDIAATSSSTSPAAQVGLQRSADSTKNNITVDALVLNSLDAWAAKTRKVLSSSSSSSSVDYVHAVLRVLLRDGVLRAPGSAMIIKFLKSASFQQLWSSTPQILASMLDAAASVIVPALRATAQNDDNDEDDDDHGKETSGSAKENKMKPLLNLHECAAPLLCFHVIPHRFAFSSSSSSSSSAEPSDPSQRGTAQDAIFSALVSCVDDTSSSASSTSSSAAWAHAEYRSLLAGALSVFPPERLLELVRRHNFGVGGGRAQQQPSSGTTTTTAVLNTTTTDITRFWMVIACEAIMRFSAPRQSTDSSASSETSGSMKAIHSLSMLLARHSLTGMLQLQERQNVNTLDATSSNTDNKVDDDDHDAAKFARACRDSLFISLSGCVATAAAANMNHTTADNEGNTDTAHPAIQEWLSLLLDRGCCPTTTMRSRFVEECKVRAVSLFCQQRRVNTTASATSWKLQRHLLWTNLYPALASMLTDVEKNDDVDDVQGRTSLVVAKIEALTQLTLLCCSCDGSDGESDAAEGGGEGSGIPLAVERLASTLQATVDRKYVVAASVSHACIKGIGSILLASTRAADRTNSNTDEMEEPKQHHEQITTHLPTPVQAKTIAALSAFQQQCSSDDADAMSIFAGEVIELTKLC